MSGFEEREAREAYAALWMQELWGTCPELTLGERLQKRRDDRDFQDLVAIHLDAQAVPTESTEVA